MTTKTDDKPAELLKSSNDKSIPMVLGFPAGHCGKCGAPYFQDSYTGALRPLCACWNLPQIKTQDHT